MQLSLRRNYFAKFYRISRQKYSKSHHFYAFFQSLLLNFSHRSKLGYASFRSFACKIYKFTKYTVPLHSYTRKNACNANIRQRTNERNDEKSTSQKKLTYPNRPRIEAGSMTLFSVYLHTPRSAVSLSPSLMCTMESASSSSFQFVRSSVRPSPHSCDSSCAPFLKIVLSAALLPYDRTSPIPAASTVLLLYCTPHKIALSARPRPPFCILLDSSNPFTRALQPAPHPPLELSRFPFPVPLSIPSSPFSVVGVFGSLFDDSQRLQIVK